VAKTPGVRQQGINWTHEVMLGDLSSDQTQGVPNHRDAWSYPGCAHPLTGGACVTGYVQERTTQKASVGLPGSKTAPMCKQGQKGSQ